MLKNDPNRESVFLHNIAFISIPEKLKALLILIAFRCQGDRKVCIQSDGSIGEILCASERTIRERLAELVKLGYVRVNNPGSPRNRTLEITPVTFAVITNNTQEYISHAQEIHIQDRKELGGNPPSKQIETIIQIGEFPPINAAENRQELGGKPPTDKEEIRLHKKNIKMNIKKNSKKEMESDFPVELHSPYKSDLKSVIEVDQLRELLKTTGGMQSVAVNGFSHGQIKNEAEVFISANEKEKYSSKAQLQYKFIDYLQAIEIKCPSILASKT